MIAKDDLRFHQFFSMQAGITLMRKAQHDLAVANKLLASFFINWNCVITILCRIQYGQQFAGIRLVILCRISPLQARMKESRLQQSRAMNGMARDGQILVIRR